MLNANLINFNVEKYKCPQENFKCRGSNKCISKFWICDGDNDCDDKSDENPELCDSCLASQFSCSVTKRCIPHSWVCDGTFDCGEGDTSDEHQYCGMLLIISFRLKHACLFLKNCKKLYIVI